MYDVETRQMRYRVYIKSVPGFYAQYSPTVEIYALDENDAENKAYTQLKRGAFPDRNRSMWRTSKIECLGS